MKNRMANEPFPEHPQGPAPPFKLDTLLPAAREMVREGRRQVEMYVRENPVIGIGAALGLGVVIGWISKRT
jgi:hypothetical protein